MGPMGGGLPGEADNLLDKILKILGGMDFETSMEDSENKKGDKNGLMDALFEVQRSPS